jgi:molybdate/tungstate transport system substrate-binding protein
MSKAFSLLVFAAALVTLRVDVSVGAQAIPTIELNVCHAGSVSEAFAQVENQFKLQNPGVAVRDSSGGSLDLARQLANGLKECDLYATADYANIDLLLKPAGIADYNIIFAHGRMVLGYLATNPKTNGIAQSGNFDPPKTIPDAVPNWYQLLLGSGVKIGGVHPFLDPGSYRSHFIFQLAQNYYKVPNLYNDLLKHYVAFAASASNETALGSDFQFSYEHSAQAKAKKEPDYRYVRLPDSVDLSNPGKNEYYRQSTIVVPGLGLTGAASTVSIPALRVAWGVTILNKAPNRDNAIKFLQLLLGSTGSAALATNGPDPVVPAVVSIIDYKRLPAALRSLVKATNVSP